jgi:hypothetical protein
MIFKRIGFKKYDMECLIIDSMNSYLEFKTADLCMEKGLTLEVIS